MHSILLHFDVVVLVKIVLAIGLGESGICV